MSLNYPFDDFRAVTYIGGLAMTHGSAHDSKRLAFSNLALNGSILAAKKKTKSLAN